MSSGLKKPWIPPPGKTTKERKIYEDVRLDNYNTASGSSMKGTGSPTSSMKEKKSSAATSVAEELIAGYPYLEAEILKKELRLMKMHCLFLESSSDLFHRSVKLLDAGRSAIISLVQQAAVDIKNFRDAYADMENFLFSLENNESEQLDVYLYLSQGKELLLSKMLKSYESVISVVKFIIEEQENADITTLCIEHENMRRVLKNLEQAALSRESHIKDLEAQLAISREQINLLERLKSSLEETRAVMQRELINRESQIARLNTQIQKLSEKGLNSGNEKMIEVLEELKEQSAAEKEALKKALRVQKNRATLSENIAEELKLNIDEKDQQIINILAEKSHIQEQLTTVTNKLTALENQHQVLKIENLNFQTVISENEDIHQQELHKLNMLLNEKIGLLNEKSEEVQQLKAAQSSSENKYIAIENDLKLMQQRYAELKEAFDMQSKNLKMQESYEAFNDIHEVLQEIKESLYLQKENTTLKKDEKTDKAQIVEIEYDSKELSALAKEIKEQLIQAKKAYQQLLQEDSKGNQILALEKDLQELKEKYGLTLQEKEQLQVQLDALEKDINSGKKILANKAKNNVYQNEFGNSFQLFTVDSNERLSNVPQYELEKKQNLLQKQIEELKEEITKKESQNSIKLLRLEEELKIKNNELSTLEKKKYEDEERLLARIRELQESLDRTNANYESLQKYVHILKSSYANVFGVP